MRCEITASAVHPKYAKFNFRHPKDKDYKGFVREALAFPWLYADDVRKEIPFEAFCKVLEAGNIVDIVWSKKLNCFVARFFVAKKDRQSDVSSDVSDDDMPF